MICFYAFVYSFERHAAHFVGHIWHSEELITFEIFLGFSGDFEFVGDYENPFYFFPLFLCVTLTQYNTTVAQKLEITKEKRIFKSMDA